MGGLAFRAPVLAALFLIVALATLAMPGSANFVGEFLILLGLFQTKLAIAIIAFTGVAMASVYMLRMFIRTMHNRLPATGVESRELTLADAARDRAARARDHRVRAVSAAGGARAASRAAPSQRPPSPSEVVSRVKGPHIDWAAISPLVALTVGACLVLLAGLLRPRVRAHTRSCRC